MTSYFIYYRVAPAQAASVDAAVGAIQAQVVAVTGIAGRLMRKTDDPDTWMEIYEGVAEPAAFEAALADAVVRTRFDRLLVEGGRRHVECFADATQVKPCA